MFKRIFRAYLVVLLVSFAVLSLAFSITVRQYLINDTLRSLRRTAETLSAGAVAAETRGEGRMRGAYFSLAHRIAYADFVLLDDAGKILESSETRIYPPGEAMPDTALAEFATVDHAREGLVEGDLVAVAIPVNLAGRQGRGALILYSRLEVLTHLNRSILGIFALALAAGSAAALLAGTLATRVVVGPLHQLKERAAELAARRFSGRLEITTGDELEDLAHAFNEMADRLAEHDRSRRAFFQQASHELKTPLMSIQGYAEALKEGIIPPAEAEQSLDIIISETRRIKTLVEEYIALSKLETNREQYRFVPVSLEEATKGAIRAVKSLALEKSVSIEAAYTHTAPPFPADPEKIHRLLLNLLGNAIRHARAAVTVTVRGRHLTISDDGPGFQEKEIDAFTASARLNTGDGSGLGLDISHSIVIAHGGEINLDNNPAGGARVDVWL